MTKKVGIVGAGPGGLVAAKTLLHDAPPGDFSVTVFDTQSRVGGLWPVGKDDNGRLVHPLMVTNQSKHTVQFSDLAWKKEDPDLPRAWQVGNYLERYVAKYLTPKTEHFSLRLGWKVTQVGPLSGGKPKWKVLVSSTDGTEESDEFDYLVVATGFFGEPIVPDCLPSNPEVPVIHSSRYRTIEDLLEKTSGKGGKILIVGGQMSGVEIAGTVASHLSAAVNAPDPSSLPGADKYSLHHIISRPSWVFPLFTSAKPGLAAAPFMPLDLSAYNLNSRPKPLKDSQGHITEEAAKTFHGIYQGILGTDQSAYSPLLAIQGGLLTEPAYLAMSEPYLDFVRSGAITLSKGKLASLDGQSAKISPSGEEVSDIAAVILATGFDASSSVSFLPQSLRDTIAISPKHINNPAALAFHGTHHPDIPHLGFVGFYRSAYWAVMEMQARFLTELWSSAPALLPPALQDALDRDVSVERTLALRDDPRASQFPMGDYLFLMQDFASALNMTISPPVGETPPLPHNNLGMDILTPARYPSKYATAEQKAEAEESLRQTHEAAIAGLTKAKYVAHAVFRSLLGEWSLERDLDSRLPSHPSGHFSGTAKFLLRDGTKDGRESVQGDLGQEYLYIEEGDFRATNGMSFRATRRYVWRYDESRDVLSVWFVKPEDQKRADYLFHEVDFVVPDAGEEPDDKGWRAKAGHLCVEDFYDVKYEFAFQAVVLREWRIGYTVSGPKKDYTINGTYTRRTRE